jgi:hypothetical protein
MKAGDTPSLLAGAWKWLCRGLHPPLPGAWDGVAGPGTPIPNLSAGPSWAHPLITQASLVEVGHSHAEKWLPRGLQEGLAGQYLFPLRGQRALPTDDCTYHSPSTTTTTTTTTHLPGAPLQA